MNNLKHCFEDTFLVLQRITPTMKNYFTLLLISCFIVFFQAKTVGQNVGIGEENFEPNPSAALEIRSNNKGVLIPTLTDIQRDNISNPPQGLLIYQLNLNEGFYYFNGTQWQRLAATTIDYDTDSLNEIQFLSLRKDTLFLTNGGFVKLPTNTVNSESGSFTPQPGVEYMLETNAPITITLPPAANNTGEKIVLHAYQYTNTQSFFLDVNTNNTSVFSAFDNVLYTASTDFSVISADKTVTLISNGTYWVLLGAKD